MKWGIQIIGVGVIFVLRQEQTRERERDCRRDDGKERRLPEYVWDYCFPGDEAGYRWTVLVGKERKSKMIMATTVPHKGGRGGFAVD
eukprot:1062470-Karenia_brevis.AAC.1